MRKNTSEKSEASPADQCERDCCCLTEGGEPRCLISESLNGQVLFTEKHQKCTYQVPFGSTFICSCPVMHDLQNKKES